MADNILSQTIFNLSIGNAARLIADSSYIVINKDETVVTFDSLNIKTSSGKIVPELVITENDQSITLENPQFQFDSTSNKIFVNEYEFRFFAEKEVNFCSLQEILSPAE